MRVPPANLQGVMQRAAQRNGVPYTLMAAIAYRESRYNPAAEGEPLKAGGRALGLFQLAPPTREQYGVTDPFDPAQSAEGAGKLLGWLIERYAWDWDAVIAAYYMGATALEQLKAQKTPIPYSVREYVTEVQTNRRWLQRAITASAKQPAAAAPGGEPQQALDLSPTAMQRLNEAIHALEQANPRWLDIRPLVIAWDNWYTPAKGNEPDSLITETQDPARLAFWVSYVTRYDRAPMTPARVPMPEDIAPTLWEWLKANAQRVLDEAYEANARVRDAVRDVVRKDPVVITVDDPQRYDPPASGRSPLLPLLAALAIYCCMPRRHHREA